MLENEIAEKVIGAAIEVHRHLGPGLLESAYDECLCYELNRQGVGFERQVHLPIDYKGLRLDCAYRLDLLVEELLIVEIKAVDQVLSIHKSQLLTYLRAAHKHVGLLINFNTPMLRTGIRRIVNEYSGPKLKDSPRDLRDLRVSALSKGSQ
jgi:GxxExxY protein